MADKESEVVKISIDLKKKTLQIEAPQDYMESHLDSILGYIGKQKKPSAKSTRPSLVPENQDKIKQYKNLVAESLAILSLGIISLALFNRSLEATDGLSGVDNIILSGWPYLAALGVFILLMGIYLISPSHKLQRCFLNNVINTPNLLLIKMLGWTLVLVPFGRELINYVRTDWAAIFGLIIISIGFLVLFYGSLKCISYVITESKGLFRGQ